MDTSRYAALAFSSPEGLAIRDMVEEAWPQWLQLVEDAPWLRNFQGSPMLRGQTRARTPCGVIVPGWPRFKHHAIADAIYATTVWGFGVEHKPKEDLYWEKQARKLLAHWPGRPSLGLYGLCETRKSNGPLPLMFKDCDGWLTQVTDSRV